MQKNILNFYIVKPLYVTVITILFIVMTKYCFPQFYFLWMSQKFINIWRNQMSTKLCILLFFIRLFLLFPQNYANNLTWVAIYSHFSMNVVWFFLIIWHKKEPYFLIYYYDPIHFFFLKKYDTVVGPKLKLNKLSNIPGWNGSVQHPNPYPSLQHFRS